MSQLFIYVDSPELRNRYREYLTTRRTTDSGVDLFIPTTDTVLSPNNSEKIGLGVVVAARTYLGIPAPCLLLPRSSISKTPLRLANSIGLIDSGYRGELAAVVDNISDRYVELYCGDRFFQICAHDFLPFTKVILVEKLDDIPSPSDDRGAGGFGSTGR
jgi:dUTP pyrophosphatase